MKKEVLIAIVIGLSFGLLVSYGVYHARKSLQTAVTTDLETPSTPTPSASPLSSLILRSPEDETVQATKDITITGTTTPNSVVVAFVNDAQQVSTADKSGNFSFQSQLNADSNVIVVHAIDQNGKVSQETRTVIYSTLSLDKSSTASSSASATSSAAVGK